MQHPYSLANIKKSPRGAITAHLTENGSIIADVKRLAPTKGCHWPFEITKFYSDRARTRFDGFSDCLSWGETLAAICPKV